MQEVMKRIKKEHAKVWFEMATKVSKVLENLDTTSTRPVETIVKDMTNLLNQTGYRVFSGYESNTYEYFDFDLFREDGYGIRVFLGHKWFEKIYVHKLEDMYLYAPNDTDDYMSDVTIEELEKIVRS